MAIAFGVKNQTGGALATQTITLAVNPADVLVLMVHFNAGAGPLPTLAVTDSAGNTWTRAGFSQDNGTGSKWLRSEMWVAANPSFSGTDTVTLAFSTTLGTGNATYTLASFTGVDNAFPILDPCTFSADYSGANSNPGNFQKVSLAGAMSVAMAGYPSNVAFNTPTNYAVMGGNVTSSPSSLGPFYRLETAAGTDAWATGNSYAYWAAGSLTLRPAGVFKTKLDGSAQNKYITAQSQIDATLTTTAANDVIVAVIYTMNAQSKTAPTVSSIVGTNGLTWTRRSTNKLVPSNLTTNYTIEVWYAVAPTALSAKTIIANLSAPSDYTAITVFGVSGANTAKPWDTNPSLPKYNSDGSSNFTYYDSGPFSTDNPDDFVFSSETNDGSASVAPQSIAGVTGTLIGTGGAGQLTFETQYANVGALVVNKTSTFGGGTTQDWQIVVDAIQAAPQIALTSSANGGTNLSDPHATLPRANKNDLMVALIAFETGDTSNSVTTTVTSTSGVAWTKLGNVQDTTSLIHGDYSVWYAFAGSALTNEVITATVSGACSGAYVVVSAWSGVDGANPFDVGFTESHIFSTGAGNAANIPQVTTVNAGAIVIGMLGVGYNLSVDTNYPLSSGFTDLGSGNCALGNGPTMRAEYLPVAGAGTVVGPETWSGVPNRRAGIAFALKPGVPFVVAPTGTIRTTLTRPSQAVVAKTSAVGTITTALTRPSQSVVAKESFSGTIHTNLAKAQMAAMGSIAANFGTIRTSLNKLAQTVTAVETFRATITTTLQGISQRATGPSNASGTITTNLQRISQHLTGPINASGTIVTRLSPPRLAAQGLEEFLGTINTALTGFNVAQGGIVAREIFTGTITTALTRVSMASVAEERFIGTIHTRLGKSNTLVTTDVKGLLIILGDVYTNLYPVDLALLGAKIGAPGQGQWYSYRYLDSGGP